MQSFIFHYLISFENGPKCHFHSIVWHHCITQMISFGKIIQKSRKEEVGFLFPVWDRWNHNKHSVQNTTPVIAWIYNKMWWPSGKDTWLSHRRSGFNPQWNLFEERFFLCLCFTIKFIPESRNLYLSTPMDDFSGYAYAFF